MTTSLNTPPTCRECGNAIDLCVLCGNNPRTPWWADLHDAAHTTQSWVFCTTQAVLLVGICAYLLTQLSHVSAHEIAGMNADQLAGYHSFVFVPTVFGVGAAGWALRALWLGVRTYRTTARAQD